jgi:hypothetical protein
MPTSLEPTYDLVITCRHITSVASDSTILSYKLAGQPAVVFPPGQRPYMQDAAIQAMTAQMAENPLTIKNRGKLTYFYQLAGCNRGNVGCNGAGTRNPTPDPAKVKANVALWTKSTSTWLAQPSCGQLTPDAVTKECDTMANRQALDIGRRTAFGNPIALGKPCSVCGGAHKEAGSTGPCYRRYLYARLSGKLEHNLWAMKVAQGAGLPGHNLGCTEFRERVKALKGQVLWCPGCGFGSETCHGRILEKAVEWLNS